MKDGAISSREKILGGLWGALIGDAVGVPVEFRKRAELRRDPVTDMREFGTHHQPKGTWSDDGALTLCTVDSLSTREFDPADLGARFVACWERQ
jgi:ADP-ribosylglycohydrolase